MKKQILLAFLLSLVAVLSAQDRTRFFRNDRVISREDPEPIRPEWAPFFHGVASGDPLSDRVIIWTRVTPEVLDDQPVPVQWRIASDPDLQNILQSGEFNTGQDRDYTVKVDVTGLEPATTYYYGFTALGKHSLTGRTRTTPVGDAVRHLRFGVVSCSNYQDGYFNAYQRLSERHDLDAILHLGDYIYEAGDGEFGEIPEERPLSPENEIISLEDYRTRYSTYRLDTSLIRVHQQHPFIAVWDDHESANDAYMEGAENHDPRTEGPWDVRLANSKKAYFEWMPIRDNDRQQIFRTLSYGDIMDLIMLDTRIEGREKQLIDPFDPALQSPDRTLLGAEQKTWLLEQLTTSAASWKIIGQQIIFAPFEAGWLGPLTQVIDADTSGTYGQAQNIALDIWNGYPAERRQIIEYIQEKNIDNVVILTGDFHTSFAFDVVDKPVDITFEELPVLGLTPYYTPNESYDPETGEGSAAVEFATPSITSINFDEVTSDIVSIIVEQLINKPVTITGAGNIGNPNPHMKYADLSNNGYFILDVKPDSVQADWFFTEILRVVDEERFAQAWYTLKGENRLRQAAAPAAPKDQAPTPAPSEPPVSDILSAGSPARAGNFVLLGVSPNPFRELNTLHFSLSEKKRVRVELFDISGRRISVLLDQNVPPGLYSLQFDGGDLPGGTYVYRIRAGEGVYSTKVVKNF